MAQARKIERYPLKQLSSGFYFTDLEGIRKCNEKGKNCQTISIISELHFSQFGWKMKYAIKNHSTIYHCKTILELGRKYQIKEQKDSFVVRL